MDPEESIEAEGSEATPIEVEAEEVETTEEAAPSAEAEEGQEEPAEEAETPAETTPAPEPELFELPDGRKVDAATLSREWKQNFYPDYTRKSQDLARLAGPAETPEKKDPLKDPSYIPPTYDELAAQIETRILTGMADRQAKEAADRKATEDGAIAQLAEVKATDPNVNENALFQHAMKYGFRDLRTAHQNMRDMAAAVKQTQKTTTENVQKRVDPVSAKPGATGARLDPASFGSAVDYLRALKGQ